MSLQKHSSSKFSVSFRFLKQPESLGANHFYGMPRETAICYRGLGNGCGTLTSGNTWPWFMAIYSLSTTEDHFRLIVLLDWDPKLQTQLLIKWKRTRQNDGHRKGRQFLSFWQRRSLPAHSNRISPWFFSTRFPKHTKLPTHMAQRNTNESLSLREKLTNPLNAWQHKKQFPI